MSDLALLDEDHGVHHLGYHAHVHPAQEALQGIYGLVGMHHSDHAHSSQAHIGKDLEVAGLSDLIVNGIIRPDQKQNIGRCLHAPLQRPVLGDLGRDLQIAGRLQGLDHIITAQQILGHSCSEGGLSRSGRPGDENASLAFLEPLLEHAAMAVGVEADLSHGTDGGYLQSIRERRLGYGNSHGTELNDGGSHLLHLHIALRVHLGPLIDLPGQVSQLPLR